MNMKRAGVIILFIFVVWLFFITGLVVYIGFFKEPISLFQDPRILDKRINQLKKEAERVNFELEESLRLKSYNAYLIECFASGYRNKMQSQLCESSDSQLNNSNRLIARLAEKDKFSDRRSDSDYIEEVALSKRTQHEEHLVPCDKFEPILHDDQDSFESQISELIENGEEVIDVHLEKTKVLENKDFSSDKSELEQQESDSQAHEHDTKARPELQMDHETALKDAIKGQTTVQDLKEEIDNQYYQNVSEVEKQPESNKNAMSHEVDNRHTYTQEAKPRKSAEKIGAEGITYGVKKPAQTQKQPCIMPDQTVCNIRYAIPRKQRAPVFFNEHDDDRCWGIDCFIDYASAYDGFSRCGVHTTLAETVFGKPISLQDISLFLKLSNCNYVHRCPLPEDEDPCNRWQRPAPQPNQQVKSFGAYRSDLYTTLLAPVQLKICADERSLQTTINATWHYVLPEKLGCLDTFWGASFPIESKVRIMDYEVGGGHLFVHGFAPDLTVRNNSLTNFYQDYTDPEDFLRRAILEPKGLVFDRRQQKSGFGDVSLFGMIDVGNNYSWIDFWNMGINFIFPSGGKIKSDKVWELHLGNGGAFRCEFFSTLLFDTGTASLNPIISADFIISTPFNACYRIPQCKSSEAQKQAKLISDLYVPGPTVFPEYFVAPYQEIDSSIPYFADEAVLTDVNWGTEWSMAVGNYFFDFGVPSLRFGLFYQYRGKLLDKYRPRDREASKFVPEILEKLSKRYEYRLSWELSYSHRGWLELTLSTAHTLGGKNIAQNHDIMLLLMMAF